MKRDKLIGIIFAVINLLLIVCCIILYCGTDRVEPKFMIQAAEVIYTPQVEKSILMEGISANDNKDGDVTDRIVIEKINENQEEETAVVYYAVSDKAGNVAKMSKLFRAEFSEEEKHEEVLEQETEAMPETETEQMTVINDMTETEKPEETQESEEAEEQESEETKEAEEEQKTEEEKEPEETKEEETKGQESKTEEQKPEEQTRMTKQESGAPELALGRSEITIEAGTNPPWVDIISIMRDDKDNYETLYYNLHVSEYNRSKSGTYPVTVYVEDSDGNRSNTLPFTIIVR